MPGTTTTPKIAGYETTYVTRNDQTDEALKTFHERLVGIVGAFKGEIILTEDWGKKKLAYPISKESRAHYSYFVYTGEGDIVHEIERNLRLNEFTLRFLTVKLEDEFDADVYLKRRTELQAAAKRREEEREARREERNAERRGYDTSYSHEPSYSHDAPEAIEADDVSASSAEE